MKLIELTYSAEELEALSDKDLEARFQPFFHITRPEEAKKQQPVQMSAGRILATKDKATQDKIAIGLAIIRKLQPGLKI